VGDPSQIKKMKLCYAMMTLMVFTAAFEFIVAKPLMETVSSITIIWLKFTLASLLLLCIKLVRDRRWPFRIRDIPYFFICGLVGEVLYYLGVFKALTILPVALVTVVIALSPVMSIILERVIFSKRVRLPSMLGICISFFGICLIAGLDPSILAGGRFLGYLLAFVGPVTINVYNLLITAKLSGRYNVFDLTMYLCIAVSIVTLPFALGNLPRVEDLNVTVILSIAYLGFALGALSLFIYINSLVVLGPTTTLLFMNFVPVVTCVFGWLCLGEIITPGQMIGGAITLIGCAAVIWYSGRADLSGR